MFIYFGNIVVLLMMVVLFCLSAVILGYITKKVGTLASKAGYKEANLKRGLKIVKEAIYCSATKLFLHLYVPLLTFENSRLFARFPKWIQYWYSNNITNANHSPTIDKHFVNAFLMQLLKWIFML